MFPEYSLRQETERKEILASERGPYQIPANEPTAVAVHSIFDADEEFREEDLYLDIGVGD
jgi:hypothetical protein